MGDGIKHVYIVGCKGIPARYGGFETFVEKLTENRVSDRIRYHVACAVDEMPHEPEYEHNGAHCFCIRWRPIGAARAIAYDLDALWWAIRHAERTGAERPVFYVLACRIGPFVGRFARPGPHAGRAAAGEKRKGPEKAEEKASAPPPHTGRSAPPPRPARHSGGRADRRAAGGRVPDLGGRAV